MLYIAVQLKDQTTRSIVLMKLSNKIKFFKQYVDDGNEEVITKCSKELTIEVFQENQTVFNAGDVGSKFYLIIKGSAKVLIPTKKTFEFTFSEYIRFLRDNYTYITSINKLDTFQIPDPVSRIFNNHVFK